jgi:hypothetical protein
MSRIRTRLERLERRCPVPESGINWINMLARSPADIEPDGVVDWYSLLFGPPPDDEPCPVEEMIRQARLLSPAKSSPTSTSPPSNNENSRS